MDDERDKLTRELHARRRRVMAQELKEYLSELKDQGVWAVISAQPVAEARPRRRMGKVVPFPTRNRGTNE